MTRGTSSPSTIGRLVLFNGPPSSGKTSLVEELQIQLTEPWFHLSLDTYRSGIPDQWWDDDDGRIFDRVMTGYLVSLEAMVATGVDVLAEAVITPGRWGLYDSAFGETPITLIGVMCSLEVATERERARGDRRRGPIDLGADEFAAVYAGLSYDWEIDTTTKKPVDLARDLAPRIHQLDASRFSDHLK